MVLIVLFKVVLIVGVCDIQMKVILQLFFVVLFIKPCEIALTVDSGQNSKVRPLK